jgi:chromosomal replication initiation ATPase DnaA
MTVTKRDRQLVDPMAALIGQRYGRTGKDLLQSSRFRFDAYPRFALMAALYELREPCGRRRFSTIKVGKLIGRDHSTVVDGIKRYRLIQTIDAMAAAIAGPARRRDKAIERADGITGALR